MSGPSEQTLDRRRRPNYRLALVRALLVIIVTVALFPYLYMLIASFKSNEQFNESYWAPALPLHVENYVSAWRQIAPYFLTSASVAVLSSVFTIVLSSTAAFVLSRFEFPGRRLLWTMVVVLMMIPGITSLIPMFILMRDLHLLNTLPVLVIPQVAGHSVLGIILFRTYIDGLPQELFDSALIDGAGGARLFRHIVAPLSGPIAGTVALLAIISAWDEFFWPLLTITTDSLRTIPVGLAFFQGQNLTKWGPMFAGYTLASLPLLLLFTFLSKYFLAGLQGGLPGVGK